MSISNERSLCQDILAHLQDPEYCDVRIVATDGEIAANKTILGIRSKYFRSMFSANNNFVESSTGCVKLPYAKAVLEKVIIYLYSGKMEFDDLDLRPLLDLMELLNLIDLPLESETVESFTMENIKKGKFSFSDCLVSLDDCSKMGLKDVGETLLVYLGENFVNIGHLKEVGALSESMIVRLLQEKQEESDQTTLRLNILTTWLSVNSMDDEVMDEVLQTVDFDHFTTKELASDVRKSGLYHPDKIIKRMEQLFENKDNEFETLSAGEKEIRLERDQLMKENDRMRNEKDQLKKQKDLFSKEKEQLRIDLRTVKTSLNSYNASYHFNPWSRFVPEDVRMKHYWL